MLRGWLCMMRGCDDSMGREDDGDVNKEQEHLFYRDGMQSLIQRHYFWRGLRRVQRDGIITARQQIFPWGKLRGKVRGKR